MLNIGHRGAMGHAPENTLESVQTALNMGVDWIEIDVYVVEETLVVIHDDDVDRTTDGSGPVMAHTLPQLRALDAGNGQQIPLLSEVMALMASHQVGPGGPSGRVGLNIELKGANTAAPVVRFLDSHLPADWPTDKILLSAFDHTQLLEAKKHNPIYQRAPLYWMGPIDYPFVINELEAVGINPSLHMVTGEMVEQAHAQQLNVWVYTVNATADIERMRQIGVDGIFTNYPDRV